MLAAVSSATENSGFDVGDHVPALLVLLGTLLGGALASITSLLLAKRAEKAERAARLWEARRGALAEVIILAFSVRLSFARYVVFVHGAVNETELEPREARLREWDAEFEKLNREAQSARLVVSPRVARLVKRHVDVLYEYLNLEESQGSPASELQSKELIGGMHALEEKIIEEARKELDVRALDKKYGSDPWTSEEEQEYFNWTLKKSPETDSGTENES